MKRTEKSKRKRIRGGIAALPFLLAALTVLPSCSMASMFVAMSVGGERFQNAVQRSLDMNYGAPARDAEGVYVISDNPTSFQQEIAYIYANGAQFDGKELQLCGIFGTLTEKGKTYYRCYRRLEDGSATGMEIRWADGGSYPLPGEEVTVQGRVHVYEDERYSYCELLLSRIVCEDGTVYSVGKDGKGEAE